MRRKENCISFLPFLCKLEYIFYTKWGNTGTEKSKHLICFSDFKISQAPYFPWSFHILFSLSLECVINCFSSSADFFLTLRVYIKVDTCRMVFYNYAGVVSTSFYYSHSLHPAVSFKTSSIICNCPIIYLCVGNTTSFLSPNIFPGLAHITPLSNKCWNPADGNVVRWTLHLKTGGEWCLDQDSSQLMPHVTLWWPQMLKREGICYGLDGE